MVFRPSLLAVKLLSLLHCAAALILMFTHPTVPIALAFGMALLASWAWTRRHAAFGYGSRAVIRLIWPEQGPLKIATPTEEIEPATLLARSVVTGFFICLQFRLDSGRFRSRVLLGDELAPDAMRRLRARLLLPLPSPAIADAESAAKLED